MNFVFCEGDAHRRDGAADPRQLSGAGALIFAGVVSLLCVAAASCLRTDAQAAVLSLISIPLMLAAVYFCCALLCHGRYIHLCLSAICGVILSLLLVGDMLCALLPICFYLPSIVLWLALRGRRATYTGMIVVSGGVVGAVLLVVFCALVYTKYAEISLSSFVRAYESFCEVILSSPRATLAMLEAEAGEGMQSFIDSYRSLVLTLDEMLDIMLYSVPSLFMSVCAIGGFICVYSYKRNIRMQALEDHVGGFEMSVVSAVLYILLNLLVLFIDPITPLGIALITVSAPIELGLALFGGIWGYYWIKKHNKSQIYYVIAILLAVMMPSVCVSLLAYLGAYNTVLLFRLRRLAEKDQSNIDRGR